MPAGKLEWIIAGIAVAALLVLATSAMMLPLGAEPYDERQGMVTADAPAHAAVTWIDASTFTHEALHAAPLRKGDKLK
jgi:hypothetical protein